MCRKFSCNNPDNWFSWNAIWMEVFMTSPCQTSKFSFIFIFLFSLKRRLETVIMKTQVTNVDHNFWLSLRRSLREVAAKKDKEHERRDQKITWMKDHHKRLFTSYVVTCVASFNKKFKFFWFKYETCFSQQLWEISGFFWGFFWGYVSLNFFFFFFFWWMVMCHLFAYKEKKKKKVVNQNWFAIMVTKEP